jgi:hypothetical protein
MRLAAQRDGYSLKLGITRLPGHAMAKMPVSAKLTFTGRWPR